MRKQVYYDFDNAQADYKKLFEESPIPMWVYDCITLKFLAVNAAAIHFYGYSNEEFLRMAVHDLRPKHDISTLLEIVKMPTLNSFYDSGRRRHVKKNGEAFFAQVYSHATRFGGKMARVMLAMDINNKVIIEQRNEELNQLVKVQKKRLDDILASVNEVIWSCRADNFEILYINTACVNVYGHKPTELIGDNKILFDIIHPEDRKLVRKAMDNVLADGKASFEYRIFHKDGTLKYIHNQAVLQQGRMGQADVINGIAVDITRLRMVEEQLKLNVSEIETILESITDGFFAVNANWEFTYINKESEILLRRRRENIIGKNIWQNFPSVIDLQFYRELHKAIEDQVSVHFEDYFPQLQKWFLVNAYPTKDGLAVYFRDITEEKEQAIQIQAQNKKLMEIAWLQSHKVRGPVANILGLVQLFNYDDPADPVNKEILDGIRTTTNYLDDVIKEIVNNTNTATV
ncbi:MAG TPA: PAS domain S-box protein [Flavipsychrobacter sp.]|nr:PAS domain S-box protein [Flavipsychrobacter sp.]